MTRLLATLAATVVCAFLLGLRADAAPNRTEARIHKSQSVLRFFQTHEWLVAPRRQRCSSVPWTRSCLIGRERVRWHTRRLDRIKWTIPVSNDWRTSVLIVQRVYPGTASWLLSCSAAEGGHGRWVRYGGGSYYPGYEHTDAVGGQMQFRPSTYYGAARRSYDYLTAKGFRIPRHEVTGLEGWLSPMGQALAAAYLRAVDGSSRWHWAASISNGCR